MTIIGFTSSLMFLVCGWHPNYANDVWGFSLIKTGLLLTIMPGTMTLIAFPAGRFADTDSRSYGYRVLLLLLGLFTASMIGSTPLTHCHDSSCGGCRNWNGYRLGNTTAAGTRILTDLVGTGTAILQTSYRIGRSLGSAVVAAIWSLLRMPTTHKWSIWAIVITGVVTVLCLFISKILGMFSYAEIRSDFVPSSGIIRLLRH